MIEVDTESFFVIVATAALAAVTVAAVPRRFAPPVVVVELLLYRVLSARDRAALAFYSATELPLVVAITTIATDTGNMKSSTAAGLVGAAMLSTLVFPFVAMALRKEQADAERDDPSPSEGAVAPAPG